MTADHIHPAARLDSRAFTHSWNEEEFAAELKKDYAYYCVLSENGDITGYAGIWCIYETAELIRIAVSPDRRRDGLGSLLMADILDHAAAAGCEKMMLEVRASNTAARAMYEKHGFCQTGIRRRYYDGTEDAVIMEKELKG